MPVAFLTQEYQMKFRSIQLGFGLALAILVAGCGGGGGGSASLGPTLDLSISALAIDYGQTVSVSWSTSRAAAISATQTSFPVDTSQVNGTLIDTPGTSTTYTVTAIGNDGSQVTKSVSVTVNASTKKILLLADQAQAGVPQITSELQALTTIPIQTGLTLPASITADLIVIGGSSAVTPGDQAAIRAFLTAGGRVVLVGSAPQRLANGTTTSSDISSIGSWFAGGTTSSFSITQGTVVGTSPVGVPLSATLFGRDIAGDHAIAPVAGSAIGLTTDKGFAFAYKPPIGGRVGFASTAPSASDSNSVTSRSVFLAICRWALSDN